MSGLRGVVGGDGDSVGEGAVLAGRDKVQGWEAVVVEEVVEVGAGGGEGEEGGEGWCGLEDLEEDFVG